MDNVPDNILRIVDKYILALEKNNIPIQDAILYGSYANGRWHKHSDIDIALVSDAFDGIRFFDRRKLMKITLRISNSLEPMPFTPENFTIDDPFVKNIMDTGIRIRSR